MSYKSGLRLQAFLQKNKNSKMAYTRSQARVRAIAKVRPRPWNSTALRAGKAALRRRVAVRAFPRLAALAPALAPAAAAGAAAYGLYRAIRPARFNGRTGSARMGNGNGRLTTGSARMPRVSGPRSGLNTATVSSIGSNAKAPPRKQFELRGASKTKEIYGSITDPNCVYLGVASMNPVDMLQVAWMGVLRRLFFKGGVNIPDVNRPLNEYIYAAYMLAGSQGNASSINLIYQEYNATTGLYNTSPISVLIDPTDTLLTLASDAAFITAFQAVSATTGNFENRQYLRVNWGYAALDISAPSASYPIVLASVDLNDLTIFSTGQAHVKIQNRSVNRAGEDDADAIDNVPVHGKCYDLNDIYPITNTQEAALNITPVATGVLLCRAAQCSTDGFKVPPPAKYFKNCSGSKNIVMTAGQMTTYRVNHSTTVKGWNAFLLNLSYHSSSINSTTGGTRHTHLGKMSLVSLEKMMRTASTENVSLFYEASQFIASYCVEKSKSYIITDFDSTESNSAAA